MSNLGLCIGINKYTNKTINSLRVCDNDAKVIQSILIDEPYNYDKVDLLSTASEYPSKSNILHFFRELAEMAVEEDTLLFYYSGHGFRTESAQYLVPCDGSPKYLDSFIDIGDLKKIIKASKARQKIFIIDACKSAEDLAGLKKLNLNLDPEKIKTEFMDIQGVYMMFSSSKDQVSWEDSSGEHSVFTNFLVKALRGEEDSALRDEVLTVESLFESLSYNVARYSRVSCAARMTPVLYSVTTTPLILANFKDVLTRRNKNIYEVFVPASTPTYTYISRDTESDLLNILRRPGKQTYLHGPSGCGKTCLYDKVLRNHDHRFVVFTCMATISELGSLYSGICKEVELKMKEYNLAINPNLQNMEINSDTVNTLAKEIADNNIVLILDDFHRLPINVIHGFADTLKVLVSHRAKVIMVGVTNTADQLYNVYPDLSDRIDGLELPCLSKNELRSIIQKGQDALNFEFDASLINGILEQSLGSASLVHDLSLSILEDVNFIQGSTKLIKIAGENLLKRACTKIAHKKAHSYSPIFRALSYEHSKARIYSSYRMIMETLALLTTDRRMIHKEELYDRINKKYGEDAPEITRISQALTSFKDIQKRIREVVSYNERTEEIEIIDSGFKFFLNWEIRPSLTDPRASYPKQDAIKSSHEELSAREYQIFCLIAKGKTIKDIADELVLSVKTIATYRMRILEKMGMKNNDEMALYAVQNNLSVS